MEMYVIMDERENEIVGIARNLASALITIWDLIKDSLDENEMEQLVKDEGYETVQELQHDFFNGGYDDGLEDFSYHKVPVLEV